MPIKHGELINLGGKPLRVFVLGDSATSFNPPADLSPNEARQYRETLQKLKGACAQVQRMADRLMDSADGLTHAGAGVVAENMASLKPPFAQEIAGYVLGLIKNGSTLHSTRGSVIVPPCSRADFEAAVSGFPTASAQKCDMGKWLDQIYNPEARVTQGYYLFETDADWKNFRAQLGASYETHVARATELFRKAVSGGLSAAEMKEYDHVGQEISEAQKALLEPALADDEYARGMCTRVRVKVDAAGTITLKTSHYTEEFASELSQLAVALKDAANALPTRASELKGVLEAQAAWCTTPSKDPNWGQSLQTWVNAKDPRSVIDVNVTCEEKDSHVGAKSCFHVLVTQHTEVPDALKTPWEIVKQSGEKTNVHTLLLNTLMVAGGSSTYTIAGEKLPDPAEQPAYKSMTFRNTTELVMIDAQSHAIAAATGRDLAAIENMRAIPVLGVTLHEFGHTLGDHAAFLGEHGGSVEETNAQGSAVYLTAKLAPESIDDILVFETCWMPIRRVRQGPTEPHSRSDIALFEEYLTASGLRIADKNGAQIVEVADPDIVVNKAFETAIKMRLWEKGLPTRLHAGIVEPLDRNDPDQDRRITQAGVDLFKAQPNQAELQKETLAEVTTFFANDRLRKIGAKLDGVIAHMPPEQPLTVIPTDPRLAALVAAN